MRSEDTKRKYYLVSWEEPFGANMRIEDGSNDALVSQIAQLRIQLAERNEHERGKGEDGGECVIGLASTVCAKGTLGCSKHRTPLPTEAPREDFPVPAKKPQPQAGDGIAQAILAFYPLTGCRFDAATRERMTAAVQVIVRDRDEKWKSAMRKVGATEDFIIHAARNLGLEVCG